MTSKPTNRHIVDQLADVRAEIKVLETREKSLKDQVGKEMGKSDSLGGDEHIAKQSVSVRKGSIDAEKLQDFFDLLGRGDSVDDFRKADSIVVTIRVEKRVQEEESNA